MILEKELISLLQWFRKPLRSYQHSLVSYKSLVSSKNPEINTLISYWDPTKTEGLEKNTFRLRDWSFSAGDPLEPSKVQAVADQIWDSWTAESGCLVRKHPKWADEEWKNIGWWWRAGGRNLNNNRIVNSSSSTVHNFQTMVHKRTTSWKQCWLKDFWIFGPPEF